MQRFTLIHDGSYLGWQAVYLAFHVASRLGAPLQVLLLDSATDEETLAQNAAQVEIGGRAAGVAIETSTIPNFSLDTVARKTTVLNGLFIPRHLIPDRETASRLIEALSCPLWIVPKESETRKMAVLVEDLVRDEDLLYYAAMLSHRMNETLTGLVIGEDPPSTYQGSVNLDWMLLQNLSLPAIIYALNRLHADLLFIRLSKFSLVGGLNCSCVVYPAFVDA